MTRILAHSSASPQALFREPVSGFSHLAGALLSLVALYILYSRAAQYGNLWHIVSFSLFGITMLLMFASSALYHLVQGSGQTITRLKRLDHIAIFLLIAGTYTPFCLIPLHGPMGWWLFAIVWTLAGFGVVLKLVWITAPRWLSTLVYVAMGWLVVVAAQPAMERIPVDALLWLAAGGGFYTVGAMIYAFKWPNPWPDHLGFHEIWHLFVLAGVFCHFGAIAFGLADLPVPPSSPA
ncbi:hemolysin III family protein [Oceanobacter sp. 3_MG-2023]|uniref:PAQR family membrane homeostasis protein TrhA n=2 Tax=Gammaproteobacteria TaxID=1236 RepID=UPI002732BEBB|nr:hemolysin III family protein [Oceanobacter sp. 3_MG-2023]MDP2505712.1 hemolysin III family protein [Oceanobacter sp. 3_MG-2023]